MGNWRTVNITGTCSESEVGKLRNFLAADYGDPNWNCLMNGGLCGLGNWASTRISAIGNLGERDYSPEDVEDALGDIRQLAAPSLRCKVHCGSDYEDLNCVATVICDDRGVRVEKPEIREIMGIPESQVRANLAKELGVPL